MQGVLFHYSFHFVFFCHVLEVDYLRVATFVIGVSLFLLSRVLSSNPFFYYLTGITVGVSASILILVYFFIKLLPLKVSIYYLLCLRLKLNFGSWQIFVCPNRCFFLMFGKEPIIFWNSLLQTTKFFEKKFYL